MSTSTAEEYLLEPGGHILLHRQWAPKMLCDTWFQALREELVWTQSEILIYGQRRPIPRLNAWYGAPHLRYRWSSTEFTTRPWTDTLSSIVQALHRFAPDRYNSVLANFYRSGADSVAWHADDEPALGTQPSIASLSLGGTRRMQFRRKGQTRSCLALDLSDGDLLIMRGTLQQYYQHQITKTRRAVAPRINLTFRHIEPTL